MQYSAEKHFQRLRDCLDMESDVDRARLVERRKTRSQGNAESRGEIIGDSATLGAHEFYANVIAYFQDKYARSKITAAKELRSFFSRRLTSHLRVLSDEVVRHVR